MMIYSLCLRKHSGMVVIPPLMTYAEARSPHTMDTPFLMTLGGLALFIIGHITIIWF